MHKHFIFGLLIFCLVACTPSKIDKHIVLGVYRGGWINILNPHHTYSVSADGLGQVSASLPSGLGNEPNWSRDGRRVVFTASDLDPNNPTLYIMQSSGENRIRIFAQSPATFSPRWSPDGTRVAYFDPGGERGINLLNVDCLLRGEKCQPSPTFLTHGESPDWSPDGKSIVYEEDVGGILNRNIFAMNLDGTGKRINLTPDLHPCRHPRWSPDGTRIVFSCSGTLYIANIDGAQRKEIASGKNPEWGPDGDKIAFVAAPEGLGKCIGFPCGSSAIFSDALFLINIDGTHLTRLSQRDDEAVLWFAWVP